jgi:hypothetical protein
MTGSDNPVTMPTTRVVRIRISRRTS